MRVQLRDYVRIGGDTSRNVEASAVDWVKRCIFLPDGRWVPFENVVVGDAQPIPAGFDEMSESWSRSAYATGELQEWKCGRCGKTFPKPSGLGGHKRHCGK